ncbi:MAG TPA: transglutaminase-like domain-containing protein [Pirellulaceae bacterium]|nr:transglutaminase-like domain-containing protein [Pirellulaceae bacterium]
MTNKPETCRPEAFAYFLEQVPRLGTTEGLWRAALAISMHTLTDVDPAAVDQQFEELAERVRAGSRSGKPISRWAHLHGVLFDQDGFAGNLDQYYQPQNSFLSCVLETHRGLPIALALIYKVVAERVGLRVEGINSPGHFLVRINADGKWQIVDPFFHGQLLTRDEALARLSELTGTSYFGREECLHPATHHQWLSRILANLQNVFASEGRQNDLTAMGELQRILWDDA